MKLLIPILVILCFITAVPFFENHITAQEPKQEDPQHNRLVHHDGNNARDINALGFEYYRINRFSDAIVAFERAVFLDPEYSTAYNNMGAAYLSMKGYVKAEKAFKKALEINPGYVKAACNLSVAFFRQERYYKAFIVYKKAQKIDAEYVNKRFSESKAKKARLEVLRKQEDRLDYSKGVGKERLQ